MSANIFHFAWTNGKVSEYATMKFVRWIDRWKVNLHSKFKGHMINRILHSCLCIFELINLIMLGKPCNLSLFPYLFDKFNKT